MSNPEHDQLYDGDRLGKQQRAVCPKEAQSAFELAPPIKRQELRQGFEQPEILIRGHRQQRGIPKPGGGDQDEGADERETFEDAAPGDPRDEKSPGVHTAVNGGIPGYLLTPGFPARKALMQFLGRRVEFDREGDGLTISDRKTFNMAG